YGLTGLLPRPGVVRSGSVVYHPQDGPPLDIMTLTSAGLRAFRWAETSIVFQGAMNSLNPVHKVSTQLEDVLEAHEPRMSRRARHSRAAGLLKLVGISAARLDSSPHQLSGGLRVSEM